MSKHRNYINYSKPNNQPIESTPVVEEETAESSQEVIEETVDASPVEVEKFAAGKVTNCSRLRVRKNPNAYSEVLCVIDSGSPVEVYVNEDTNEFYKVYTEAGVEGYCMKQYIELLK